MGSEARVTKSAGQSTAESTHDEARREECWGRFAREVVPALARSQRLEAWLHDSFDPAVDSHTLGARLGQEPAAATWMHARLRAHLKQRGGGLFDEDEGLRPERLVLLLGRAAARNLRAALWIERVRDRAGLPCGLPRARTQPLTIEPKQSVAFAARALQYWEDQPTLQPTPQPIAYEAGLLWDAMAARYPDQVKGWDVAFGEALGLSLAIQRVATRVRELPLSRYALAAPLLLRLGRELLTAWGMAGGAQVAAPDWMGAVAGRLCRTRASLSGLEPVLRIAHDPFWLAPVAGRPEREAIRAFALLLWLLEAPRSAWQLGAVGNTWLKLNRLALTDFKPQG